MDEERTDLNLRYVPIDREKAGKLWSNFISRMLEFDLKIPEGRRKQ